MLPGTSARVRKHTPPRINARIRRDIEQRLHYFAHHPDEIEERLRQLDREWDIERTLETNASALALLGVVLGATGRRGWFVLPGVVSAFLLQHALQGWCPPVPLFRRLGVRTASEIEFERYALKAVRGDFQHLGDPGHAGGDGVRELLLHCPNGA
jgi:hypothetical protein